MLFCTVLLAISGFLLASSPSRRANSLEPKEQKQNEEELRIYRETMEVLEQNYQELKKDPHSLSNELLEVLDSRMMDSCKILEMELEKETASYQSSTWLESVYNGVCSGASWVIDWAKWIYSIEYRTKTTASYNHACQRSVDLINASYATVLENNIKLLRAGSTWAVPFPARPTSKELVAADDFYICALASKPGSDSRANYLQLADQQIELFRHSRLQ